MMLLSQFKLTQWLFILIVIVGPTSLQAESFADSASAESVIFDFAKNRQAAHVRSDGLLIDLGTPSGYKYTLDKDVSGWQGDFSDEGTTFSNIKGPSGKLLFFADADESGLGTISIRGRSTMSVPTAVVLNGTEIGRVTFGTRRFSVDEVSFRRPLPAGVNLLELLPIIPPDNFGSEDTVSIDYVRIIPDARLGSESIMSYENRTVDNSKNSAGIPLSSDESITYNLFIPEGATLVLEAAFNGPAKGEVGVEIESDSLKHHYHLLEESTDEDRLEIDLHAFEGRAAAVRFTAEGEDTVLTRAVLEHPFDPPRRISPVARNVVVILIDTLRADRLRLFNRQSRVNAPYITRLGAESVVFDRTFAPSNWTKPSVATLMTGVPPRVHGANTHSALLNSRLTIASEHFQQSGFDTAGFVANGYISSRFGFGRGWNYLKLFGGASGRPDRGGVVVENALQWLQKHPKKKRFFMYVHTIDPHAPYVSPKKYQTMYEKFFYRGFIKPKETATILNEVRSGRMQLGISDKSYLEALYDSEVTYLDEVIGHFMRMIRKLNLLEDTLLIVTSDHGEEFFEHGSLGHGHSLYEELLRVPLIIRLPGAQYGGTRRDREAGLSDLLPTMCEILRTPCPEQVQGQSLVPSFSAETTPDFPEVSVSEYPSMAETAVRMGRFKAIFRKMTPVLYDLVDDPHETTDVSAAYPIALAALRDALGGYIAGEAAREDDAPPPAQAAIDEESEAGLRALGYLGD